MSDFLFGLLVGVLAFVVVLLGACHPPRSACHPGDQLCLEGGVWTCTAEGELVETLDCPGACEVVEADGFGDPGPACVEVDR